MNKVYILLCNGQGKSSFRHSHQRRCFHQAVGDYCLEIPKVQEYLTPIVVSVPLQLLAYYIAVLKGKDVGQPRNLAKSVTVK